MQLCGVVLELEFFSEYVLTLALLLQQVISQLVNLVVVKSFKISLCLEVLLAHTI